MAALRELADVIRSKNVGPFELTFDVIFSSREAYLRVKASKVLTRELICRLYGVEPGAIVAFLFFDPAQAFKFTLERGWAQGSVNERDTFGAQQHAPLMDIDIPEALTSGTHQATSEEFMSWTRRSPPARRPSRSRVRASRNIRNRRRRNPADSRSSRSL